jgi:hypothetical protein
MMTEGNTATLNPISMELQAALNHFDLQRREDGAFIGTKQDGIVFLADEKFLRIGIYILDGAESMFQPSEISCVMREALDADRAAYTVLLDNLPA